MVEADRRKESWRKKEWKNRKSEELLEKKKIEADRRKKKWVERPQRAGERKIEEPLESSESKGKKRRGCTNMGIRVWLTKCKRKKKEKKKRRKHMEERKGKEEEITI